ncbi:hypothetical protein OS493_017574 [Desmophyllum pertusum]|uniref:RING-type domain-containing protein n=1 Tax=Desmophyllum pertusum TaxID=174260 RepID=A0A9X0D2V5_9CNID|nr:hypothetical protein OS493_017574 [Desmophyllum pertusum]
MNETKERFEGAITFIPSSSIERTEISEGKAFEILEVTGTATVGLVEETSISLPAQDNSRIHLAEELNLNLNKADFKLDVMGTNESTEKAPMMMTPDIQQPKLMHVSTQKDQNEETHFTQGSAMDTTTAADKSSNLSSLRMDGGLFVTSPTVEALSNADLRLGFQGFVTSPTVEALLNADLRLGFQGLHIEHDRNRNIKETEKHEKGNKRFQHKEDEINSDENSSLACSNPSSNDTHSNRIMEKHSLNVLNENLEPGIAVAENARESIQKYDSEETKEKEDECESVLFENDHRGSKRNVSTGRQIAFLCALCEDTVDHPDLIHPNICAEHKFCDDCILTAFTFSSNCPACVDTYGLITSETSETPNNVEHNRKYEPGITDRHSSSSSSPNEQKGKPQRTARSDFIQANQPPEK